MISAIRTARSHGFAALAALALAMTGCMPEEDPNPDPTDTTDPVDTTLAQRDMAVREIAWSPDTAALGKVAAVAERGATTAAFGDTGAVLFTSGVHKVTDAGLTTVQSAAVIPAADHNGQWIAGADAEGKVWRLVAGETFEVVSSLYGLADESVTGLAPFGDAGTVLAVEGALAISDGATVTRYDTGTLAGVTTFAGRVAGVGAGGPAVLDVAGEELTTFDLPEVTSVAFDDKGRLLALSPDTLYREATNGTLIEIYRSETGDLGGLAQAPGRVWFSEGTVAGMVDPEGVALSPEGALPAGAALTGSPSGDVWVIADGALTRIALDVGNDGARHTWETDIQPIFEASCTPCHLAGGTAPVHLSTYDAWETHRESLTQRVLVKGDMPPQGFELSAEDRKVIEDWLSAK